MHYQVMSKSNGSTMSGSNARALARGLGWVSLALGVAEVVAPRTLARSLGMRGQEELVRVYGLRELATGIGILSARRNPAPWIWARVGGDALDIATLARRADRANPRQGNVVVALAAVAGITAVDVICAQQLSAQPTSAPAPVKDYSNRRGMPRPPAEMRGAARDFEVPRDMRIPQAMRPFTAAPRAGEKPEGKPRHAVHSSASHGGGVGVLTGTQTDQTI
jgi:hypothetical protein